ncbi:hypothetical protein D3C71_1551180 [compost metagenome]
MQRDATLLVRLAAFTGLRPDCVQAHPLGHAHRDLALRGQVDILARDDRGVLPAHGDHFLRRDEADAHGRAELQVRLAVRGDAAVAAFGGLDVAAA